MSFLSITVILVSLLVIREFHSIDGSVEQIFEKVKQEVEDLIDSQDYESVDEIVKDSKVKVKYFDYYVPTTAKPTQLTTTTPPPVKGGQGKSMTRDGGLAAPAHRGDKAADEEEDGGDVMIILGVIGGVVLVVIVAVIGIFIYVRKSKTATNKNIKKKPKRSTSRDSLSSIVTVDDNTGLPLKKGSKPASKSVPK